MHDGKGSCPTTTPCSTSRTPTPQVVPREDRGPPELGVGAIKVDFGEARPARRASTTRAAAASTSTTSTRCATTRSSRRSRRKSRATTSSGPAAPGRAASAIRSTGAATRARWTRHGRRRCAAGSRWASRLHVLEPRHRRLLRGQGGGRLSPLGPVRHAHVAHAQPRPAPEGAVGVQPRIPRRLSQGRGDEVPADAVHLRAGERLDASAACPCCARSSSNIPTIPGPGWWRTSTCSDPTSSSRRCSKPA